VDTRVVRIDNKFLERMLPVWPESSQHGIHNVRPVACRTTLHTLWVDVHEVGSSRVPHKGSSSPGSFSSVMLPLAKRLRRFFTAKRQKVSWP
jgi:hypothetical protein